jgi:hypothetical protein
MQPTPHKSIVLVSLLVLGALVVFGVTLYFSLFSERDGGSDTSQDVPEKSFKPDLVTVKHQFKDDTHTFVGSVDMPTPCDLLTTEGVAQVREPRADLITLQFTVVNEADVCAQVITPARFKMTVGAGEDAEFEALWDGAPVQLNVIDVAPGEDIDAFEVYIKG